MKKYLSAFFISAISVLTLSLNFAFAAIDDTCANYMRSGGMMDGYGWGGHGIMSWSSIGGWGIAVMIFAIALWVIFWAIVIVAVVALVRWLYMKIFKGELWIFGKKETPEDVLKMRYAKGDISKEQYEIMNKEITK